MRYTDQSRKFKKFMKFIKTQNPWGEVEELFLKYQEQSYADVLQKRCSSILANFTGKHLYRTVCSYHVTYAIQSESTLCSGLNVKKLLSWSRREIWNLSDCNWAVTHNYLVQKRTLNHLAKWLSVRLWTKWLWVRVQLQSFKLQISCLLRARSSLTFKQL